MAKKVYQLGCTVGVRDESRDVPEVRDVSGAIVQPFVAGVKYVAAGEPVELEAAEGDRLVERFPWAPLEIGARQ